MKISTVSVKQLRENFSQIKEGIESGRSYLLIYRSQPLAEIKPLEEGGNLESTKEERVKKGIETVKRLAGGLKLGRGLNPGEINALYNKTYEKLLS